jgi:hypothetical protein
LRGGVVGLDQKNGGAPGVRLSELRIARQGRRKIVQRRLKAVPILAQHPPNGQQLGRQWLWEASDHRFGIADIARIATRHGQLEIALGEPRCRQRIVCCGSHRRTQGEQFAGTGVAGPRRQPFQHFRVVARFARRGMRGQRQQRYPAASNQGRKRKWVQEVNLRRSIRVTIFVRAKSAVTFSNKSRGVSYAQATIRSDCSDLRHCLR